jgi:hypothetical protein
MAAGYFPQANRELQAVALGIAEYDPPQVVEEARSGARAAFVRARHRLARRLLNEMWSDATTLDVGIWGGLVSEVEAERELNEAAARGAIYLDPTPDPARPAGLRGRLRGLFRARQDEESTAW